MYETLALYVTIRKMYTVKYMKYFTHISMLVILFITFNLLVCIVYGNPIPVPTIILEKEYIDINIKYISDDILLVEVYGEYPFTNVGFENVTMYFPIPIEAINGNITITKNGTPIKWSIVEKGYMVKPKGIKKEFEYHTVLGKLPLIKWKLNLKPHEKFTITITYTYKLKPKKETPHTFIYETIYAMATGRFNPMYSKRCTAYINIKLNGLQNSSMTITLAPPPDSILCKESFKYIVHEPKETINLTIESSLFRGLEKDLVIRIEKPKEVKDRWVTSKPYATNINITRIDKDKLNITVTMMFRHSGFRVTWKEPIIEEPKHDTILVKIPVEVLEWTGPSLPVLTRKVKTYVLTQIPENKYIVVELHINNEIIYITKTPNIDLEEHKDAINQLLQEHYLHIIIIAILASALILTILLVKRKQAIYT